MSTLVAAYYRSSTDDKQAASIPDQKKLIGEYIKKNGYRLIREEHDEASGKTFEKRRGVMRLINEVTSGKARYSKLIILKENRWGRPEERDYSTHYELLLKFNGVIIEYVQGSNVEGIAGRISRDINYEQASIFSKQLSQDVKRGSISCAERGYSPGGFPPIGYKRLLCDENGNPLQVLDPGEHKGVKNYKVKWVPGGPSEVLFVRSIFEEVVRGKSITALVKQLNAGLDRGEGILPPFAHKSYTKKGKPHRFSDRWGQSTLIPMLKNTCYIGWREYRVDGKPVLNKEAHEPIIEESLFWRVQDRLKKRKKSARCSKTESPYLLQSKVRCRDCGLNFYGKTSINNQGTKYRYYEDRGHTDKRICSNCAIPKDGIEGFVINHIKQRIQTGLYSDLFRKILEEKLACLPKDNPYDSELTALNREIRETEKMISNIVDILIRTPSGALEDKLRELEAKKSFLKDRIRRTKNNNVTRWDAAELTKELLAKLDSFEEVLRRRSYQEQREMISLFLDRCEVEREIGVHCYFYNIPQFIDLPGLGFNGEDGVSTEQLGPPAPSFSTTYYPPFFEQSSLPPRWCPKLCP